MLFEMQVLVDKVWKSVHPSSSNQPYQFDTREKADRMLENCYPDQCREARLFGDSVVRVVEVGAEDVSQSDTAG